MVNAVVMLSPSVSSYSGTASWNVKTNKCCYDGDKCTFFFELCDPVVAEDWGYQPTSQA